MKLLKIFKKLTKKTILAILAIIVIAVPLLYLTVLNQKEVSASWFNENWLYRAAIPISAHTSAENNVYITATIDTTTPIAAGKMQSDCGDLRFTKENGELLPYFINASPGCNNASTTIQVNFDSFPAGAQTIYYYYGNPSAPNGFNSSAFATEATGATIGTLGSETQGPGPVGYWAFDEGSGTVVNDSSSMKNNGSISSATWQTEDQCISGKCLFFTSTNSVSIADPTNNSLDFDTNSFTISAWIRTGTSADHRNLIRKGADGGVSGWRFGLNNGIPDVLIGDASSYTEGYVGSVSIADNKWHLVTVVFNRSSNAVGYVDGKATNTTLNISAKNGSVNNSSAIAIGSPFAAFSGYVDEFKIYPYARSAAQIKTDYNSRGAAAKSGTGAALGAKPQDWMSNGLVGYWKMDEASGNLTDSSGNSNTGTVTELQFLLVNMVMAGHLMVVVIK